MTKGIDLKVERIRRRVKLVDLARVMGVAHPRISHIENSAQVTQKAAARYLAALSTFPVVEDEAA